MGFSRSRKIVQPVLVIDFGGGVCWLRRSDLSSSRLRSRAPANLGTIKGIVRDEAGNPIADATVAIFKASKVLKQVRSAADGSFIAKILPGTYTIFAVAQGFNPVTLADVEIGSASPACLWIQTRASRQRQHPSGEAT